MNRLLFATLIYLVSYSQADAQLSALRIGDPLPDLAFGKVLNDSTLKFRTSDFRGKLTVIDFWNTHCTVCIADMPKMDSLQKKYRDKLQIISITKNNTTEVNKLFSRVKVKKPDFPFIVEDSVFNQLFPHNGDPLHVWIDEQGKVIGITHSFETRAETLQQYFAGKMPFLLRRWDFGINTDYPLLSENNASVLNYTMEYSVLFKSTIEIMSTDNAIQVTDSSIRVINGDLVHLYKTAYKNVLYGYPINIYQLPIEDRVNLLVRDKAQFLWPAREEEIANWLLQNHYCYESKIMKAGVDASSRLMQTDLSRYFPYAVTIEKQKVQGYALIQYPYTGKTSPGTSKKAKHRLISEQPLSELINVLNSSLAWKGLHFIDESGLKGNFTIDAEINLGDMDSINNDLKPYGLKFQPKTFEINFLVIRDK